MKTLAFISALIVTGLLVKAQEPAPLVNRDSTVTEASQNDTIKREVLGDSPEVNKKGDTTRIRLGKKGIVIIEKDGKTTVEFDKAENEPEDKNYYGDHKENENGKNGEENGKDSWENWDKKHKKGFKPHFAGLELNLNNFVTSSHSMTLPSDAKFMELNTNRSIGVKLNFMEFGIPITDEMGFVTGLGLEFNSYYFASDSSNITKSNGQIVAKLKPVGSGSYEKNKLKDTYIQIPLLYEIQFPLGNSNKPLYFSAGVIGGLKIGSSTKEYYNLDGDKKIKTKDDFYLSPFRYGVQAKVGYRFIHLVGTYYFSPLFQDQKGPKLYPFDIGLVVLNF